VSVAVESQFLTALGAAFSADAGVQSVLGNPLRLTAREGEKLAFPYCSFGDVQTRSQDSSGAIGFELGVTVHVWVREGERGLGQAALAALREVVHGRTLALADYHVSLLFVVFADMFRDSDPMIVHGVLRLRAICEPK
jgi:hypothetical protein